MPAPSHLCRDPSRASRARAGHRITGRWRPNRQAGFTLIEVVLASAVLIITAAGIIAALVQAYYTAAEVRYRDEARYVLRSFADQFLLAASQDTAGETKTMWALTEEPTGTGLTWKGISSTTSTLQIKIGPNTSSAVTATVTREVRPVGITAPDIGNQVPAIPEDDDSEYMLIGRFTIAYTFRQKPRQYSLSVIRCVP